MRKLSFLIFSAFCLTNLKSQPAQPLPSYLINNIALPAELDKQVCISGMKYFNGNLCLASERCPVVLVLNPQTGTIDSVINLKVPQEFEMEGMTSYKGRLYMVSENIAAVYEVDNRTAVVKQIETSVPIPVKSKDGDGMEGIAANETNNKFYLLRERNDDKTKSQVYTFSAEPGNESTSFTLKYESMIELPLENEQWRYSDICYDIANSRLICLKSYSKGKLRQQYIESVNIDSSGRLLVETLKNITVDHLTETSATYKLQGYSTNLEGITVDNSGNIFIVSDNTSGQAKCDLPAKERTILLQLKKK
ncbi:MAG TPA: esterase-like activity of phytase family protein [Chitinophagaceae bacterium]|nr:esterase-like activity of phytase family protein [Chitinophagaceae bacterium]